MQIVCQSAKIQKCLVLCCLSVFRFPNANLFLSAFHQEKKEAREAGGEAHEGSLSSGLGGGIFARAAPSVIAH